MRPRTLHRRGPFYHRKRSHWRRNLTLALVGFGLAGFLIVGMRTGPPLPGPSEDTAKRIATPTPTVQAPARTAPANRGSTTLAASASASAPLRPGRPSSLVAGPARDASRRGLDSAGARLGVPSVRGVDVMERAPVPTSLAQRLLTPPESCKTCGDDVPF